MVCLHFGYHFKILKQQVATFIASSKKIKTRFIYECQKISTKHEKMLKIEKKNSKTSVENYIDFIEK